MTSTRSIERLNGTRFTDIFRVVLPVRLLAYAWMWFVPYLILTAGIPGLPAVVLMFSAVCASFICTPEFMLMPQSQTLSQHGLAVLLVVAGSVAWSMLVWGLIKLWWKFCY